MSLKISDTLYLYKETELSKNEWDGKAEETVNYVQKIAEDYSLIDSKVSTIWNAEYRIWLNTSNNEHELRFQLYGDTVTDLTIDHKSYRLNKNGSEIINKWFHGENGPQIVLKGNKYEKIDWSPTICMEDHYWDNWKRDSFLFGINLSIKPIYTEQLYPLVIQYMDCILGKNCRILEICGGDGELAHQILQKHSDKITKYFLLDRNKVSLEKADEALKTYIDTEQVDLIECDITKKNLNENSDIAVDIVLGVGALSKGVFERNDALHIFKQVSDQIKPGGYIILTGGNDEWIDSDMLIEAGFSIKNMMVPNTAQQFYVAQKNVDKD